MISDHTPTVMQVAAPLAALAGGSTIFLTFAIFFFFVIVYSLYTRKGSGINQHPYAKIYGGAPGAYGPSELSGRDERERASWTRGTR